MADEAECKHPSEDVRAAEHRCEECGEFFGILPDGVDPWYIVKIRELEAEVARLKND